MKVMWNIHCKERLELSLSLVWYIPVLAETCALSVSLS